MTAGDLELVQLVVSWVVNVSATALVVSRDERSLTGSALARAWPGVSRDAAVFVFSPLCVVVHFVRTRPLARGMAIGGGWLIAIVLADQGIQLLAAAAVDWFRL